ncbi:MAG: hypothetical protein HY794_07545 [Desulfarculus sp.]|nr:hypothetical protein [Desulfarculus sp.]
MGGIGFDGGLGIPAPEGSDQEYFVRKIGYRWLASRGKDACRQCALLHNKIFYFKPEPGQASVREMPKGQLHPNCGCTTEPIIEVVVPLITNPKLKPYMIDKAQVIRGLIFRLPNLNSKGSAPIYGRYGGDYWTGGRDTSHDLHPDPHDYNAPGEDDMDEIFKSHDLCYDANGRDSLECDKKLYSELEALDPDPQNWDNPPVADGDIDYAKRYRRLAMRDHCAKPK